MKVDDNDFINIHCARDGICAILILIISFEC